MARYPPPRRPSDTPDFVSRHGQRKFARTLLAYTSALEMYSRGIRSRLLELENASESTPETAAEQRRPEVVIAPTAAVRALRLFLWYTDAGFHV
jgi:hypothetical protein